MLCYILCISFKCELILIIVMLCLKMLVMPRLNCFMPKLKLENLSTIFGALELKELI